MHPLTPESRRRVSGNIPVKNYYDQYMTPLRLSVLQRNYRERINKERL